MTMKSGLTGIDFLLFISAIHSETITKNQAYEKNSFFIRSSFNNRCLRSYLPVGRLQEEILGQRNRKLPVLGSKLASRHLGGNYTLINPAICRKKDQDRFSESSSAAK
jgi:hypothetical protein